VSDKPNFGPGLLVTAAFVGPGTVATASSAGNAFAYTLVWALLFSVAATMILQEMSARSAIATGSGLATTLRAALGGNWAGRATLLGVILAIGIGNAAYESGNIAGAALALAEVSGTAAPGWSLGVGVGAALLLFLPAYAQLERVLVLMVLAMSILFLVCALALKPAWGELLRGLVPTLPEGSLTTVIALIGTTVVPYNLFLQANAARDHWAGEADRGRALAAARRDTFVSVALGGAITLAILSVAAVSTVRAAGMSAADLAGQLDPVLGPAGRYLFAAGLAAAGLTSAVTAPLAAAYAVTGALGLDDTLRGRSFRAIALAVVAIGTLFAATGARPLSLILFAQAANGLMLPVIAAVLLWLMNQPRYLGRATNGWLSNLLAGAVVLVTFALGASKLAGVFGA
jgi:NRAMP (natural resistance-associated macrophage protein)-like metal ion transporter